jgi:hypothetical protein
MSNERLVLKSKATGKIASRADQGKKAITLKAVKLTTGCKAMGIPFLLVPQSSREKAEIAAIGNKYDACFVKVRAGKKSGINDKKKLQASLKDDDFIGKLAVHFGRYVGDTPSPHAISAKSFSRWLKNELTNKNSIIYQITFKQAPVLLEVERSDRWWADAFAKRKNAELRT